MSRTTRRNPDYRSQYDHEGTQPTRKKRLNKAEKARLRALETTDAKRVAEYPIDDYPEGTVATLTEPGGRIMALPDYGHDSAFTQPRSAYDTGSIETWN